MSAKGYVSKEFWRNESNGVAMGWPTREDIAEFDAIKEEYDRDIINTLHYRTPTGDIRIEFTPDGMIIKTAMASQDAVRKAIKLQANVTTIEDEIEI